MVKLLLCRQEGEELTFARPEGASHRLSALLAVFAPRAGTDLLNCVAFGWVASGFER